MHRTIRSIGIVLLSSSLFGCMNQLESDVQTTGAANDDSLGEPPGPILGDDGLVAPDAPTLSIAASPGALNFNWVDWQNAQGSNREITLHQYNRRTELETQLDAVIDPATQRYTLPITPHRIAWDVLSYRVEICTQSDCLSSQWMPIQDLLINAVSGVTAPTTTLSTSFGSDIAVNSNGNMALVTSPMNSAASVFFNLNNQWVHTSTIASSNFSNARESSMRVTMSASGDTLAVATLSSSSGPAVVVFDRLGENWIETAVISPFNSSDQTQQWDTASMTLQISENGDRLLVGSQPATRAFNAFNDENNQLQIYDRNATSWALSANLSVPAQYMRLRSASASASINSVVTLSALDSNLYLHEFVIVDDTWHDTSTQLLDTIAPSLDSKIISSVNATQIVVAGWDEESDGRGSPVAWQFEKSTVGWVARDSIKLPPTADRSAVLKLAADAQLNSIAVGWQAQNDANLAFYEKTSERWTHQFSIPERLNLNRNVALVESVVISKHNTTALVGTPDTGNGGMVTSFR